MARRGEEAYPLIYYNSDTNPIVGSRAIAAYLGLPHASYVYKWMTKHDLPVAERTDGKYVTTMRAIDQWIFQRAAEENTTDKLHVLNGQFYTKIEQQRRQLEKRIMNEANRPLKEAMRAKHAAIDPTEPET